MGCPGKELTSRAIPRAYFHIPRDFHAKSQETKSSSSVIEATPYLLYKSQADHPRLSLGSASQSPPVFPACAGASAACIAAFSFCTWESPQTPTMHNAVSANSPYGLLMISIKFNNIWIYKCLLVPPHALRSQAISPRHNKITYPKVRQNKVGPPWQFFC